MSNWPEAGTGRMFHLIDRLADHLVESAGLAGLDAVAEGGAPPARVLVCGMGGSAIAGDLVAPLVSGCPCHVHRDYGVPAWAGPEDLVVVSSYSGDTEETLSAWATAAARGCRLVAVTTGGSLAARARAVGAPLVTLPGGLPPRAALGYGLGALVRVLAALGVVANADEAIAEAVTVLRAAGPGRLAPYARAGEAVRGAGNEPAARATAELLRDRIAVIHTAGTAAHAAGLRLRAQLNENAEVPALLASYPELDHNEIVGWNLGPDWSGRFVLLILRDNDDNGPLDRRVAVTRDLLAGEFAGVREVRARGEGVLARGLSLVQYGDFLSCHLADLRGLDPVPVARITRLKQALAADPVDPVGPGGANTPETEAP